MPRLSRRTVIGTLASLPIGISVAYASDRDTALRRVLREKRVAHRIPGLAAAVIRGSTIAAVAVDGLRRWDGRDAIGIHDRFHIASCTKSMTATWAAAAVHRGLLDWSSSLADLLPELARTMRREYRSATLEQLLAHAARMPSYTQPSPQQVAWMYALSGTPVEQRLAFLREVLSMEPPNDRSGDGAYSNVGYVAACAMVERVTGTAWEAGILQGLAAPLGLQSLGFGYPASPFMPDQPRGHAVLDGRIEVLPLDLSRNLAVCLSPAGAVHLSITDLARYARDHLNGLTGGRALLPGSYYARLHSQLPGSSSVFTLGWGMRQDDRLGRLHFGAGSGGWFFARIWIAPERRAAVVTASNSGDAGAATRELSVRLLTSLA